MAAHTGKRHPSQWTRQSKPQPSRQSWPVSAPGGTSLLWFNKGDDTSAGYTCEGRREISDKKAGTTGICTPELERVWAGAVRVTSPLCGKTENVVLVPNVACRSAQEAIPPRGQFRGHPRALTSAMEQSRSEVLPRGGRQGFKCSGGTSPPSCFSIAIEEAHT